MADTARPAYTARREATAHQACREDRARPAYTAHREETARRGGREHHRGGRR